MRTLLSFVSTSFRPSMILLIPASAPSPTCEPGCNTMSLAPMACVLSISLCRNSTPRLNRSEEHTSELQSRFELVCRLLLGKKNHDNDRTQLEGVSLVRPTEKHRAP